MGSYIKVFILLTLVMSACEPNSEPIPEYSMNLTEAEKSIVGTWQYVYVAAAGIRFEFADFNMELGQLPVEMGGNRAFLLRRRIAYLPNGTYQLRWIERGDYQLGTEGEPNWQPNYGYWRVTGGELIHNAGTIYETVYQFKSGNDTLRRTSDRLMLENYSPKFQWDPGSIVRQTEVMVKVQ